MKVVAGLILIMTLAVTGYAAEPDFNKLADAVFLAEGGSKAKVPYGIFFKGCTKQSPDYCRRIAINTFKSSYKRYLSSNSSLPFISYLASSYAPVGAKNDPSGLNKYWIKNVSYFYNKLGVEAGLTNPVHNPAGHKYQVVVAFQQEAL